MTTTRVRFALLLLLSGLGGAGWAAESHSLSPKPPWGRIVMIGASATAGFTATEMFGGTNTPFYRLSRYIDVAVVAAHEPVENLASALFFMQPEAAARNQVTQAVEAIPTLVIGVDFLFWHLYGEMRTDDDRMRRFESGLKLVESIPCPLVLGDIPDASAAISTGMLREKQVPSATVMAAANKRLKEWAAARPKVIVMPLSAFMRAAQANQPITIRGQTWPQGKTRELLQDDRLHPSPRGAAVIALAVLDAFTSARSDATTGAVRWDHEDVFRRGYKPGPVPSGRAGGKNPISKSVTSP